MRCLPPLSHPLDGQDLVDDFLRAQMAFPAVQTAGAKLAAVGAADLGGNAQGVAVARLAVKGGAGGDEDAFNERAVGQPPEEFLGGVARALTPRQFEARPGSRSPPGAGAGIWADWSFRPKRRRARRKASRSNWVTR